MEIAVITASVNTAISMARNALDVMKDDASRSAVANIQMSLLDVQQQVLNSITENVGLAQKVRALSDELAVVKAWADTAADYELVQCTQGNSTYNVFRFRGDGQSHLACPKCMSDKRIGFLQTPPHAGWGLSKLYDCTYCDFKVMVDLGPAAELPNARMGYDPY